MARPRKDADQTPVKERIKHAFWQLYQTRPIEQICVKEVCAAAACNKTTFYYHYTSTAQVLEEIEQECMLVELPGIIAKMLAGNAFDKEFVEEFVRSNGARIEMTRALLGPNGDISFKHQLEESLTSQWCDAMGIKRDRLDDDDRLFLRYSMGGMMGIVAQDPAKPNEPLDFDGIYQLAAEVILPRVGKMVERYTR